MAQSRETLELFLTEELAKERERVFLDAFKRGQEPPYRPTIQDIERHAGLWAALVPTNPSLRAALGAMRAGRAPHGPPPPGLVAVASAPPARRPV